jgi:hypoxanthine phosphoribosyltransferase
MNLKDSDKYAIGEIIIPSEEIEKCLDELSLQLVKSYKNKKLLLVGLLTGAAWITVDLLERLHRLDLSDVELTFMKVGSYKKGTKATNEPQIELDLSVDPQKRTILLIDDITDTGKTLTTVINHLKNKGTAAVHSFVLLDKPSRREVVYEPDYIGFEIPNIWVQGRGMDSDGFGRGDSDIRKGPYYY